MDFTLALMIIERRNEKSCFWGFRPVAGMYSHGGLAYIAEQNTIHKAKTKAWNSGMETAQ